MLLELECWYPEYLIVLPSSTCPHLQFGASDGSECLLAPAIFYLLSWVVNEAKYILHLGYTVNKQYVHRAEWS